MEYYRTQRGAQLLDLNSFYIRYPSKKLTKLDVEVDLDSAGNIELLKNNAPTLIKGGDHTWAANEGINASCLANKNIVEQCNKSNKKFVSIFTSETRSIQTNILPGVTNFENLRDFARKIRNKRKNYIPGQKMTFQSLFKQL
ncbi:hypothetical protein DMUE_2302 [Dictyocoela muelleri]|nr:hypothetical protein DMUE_2302 [Dictyocoela muelleri]